MSEEELVEYVETLESKVRELEKELDSREDRETEIRESVKDSIMDYLNRY